MHFLLQKRWRNEGFHSINGGSLEIAHVLHLSIITSYKKKIKNLPFALNYKNVIKKALINTAFSVNIDLV